MCYVFFEVSGVSGWKNPQMSQRHNILRGANFKKDELFGNLFAHRENPSNPYLTKSHLLNSMQYDYTSENELMIPSVISYYTA